MLTSDQTTTALSHCVVCTWSCSREPGIDRCQERNRGSTSRQERPVSPIKCLCDCLTEDEVFLQSRPQAACNECVRVLWRGSRGGMAANVSSDCDTCPVRGYSTAHVERCDWSVELLSATVSQLNLQAPLALLVVNECTRSHNFLQSFSRYAKKCGRKGKSHRDGESMSAALHCIRIRLTLPDKPTLCYSWYYKVCQLVNRRLQLDDAMNWLNTLGGGYSALGDYFTRHAVQAGNISARQLCVAVEMGELPLILRCRLYFALSSMQTGKLLLAKNTIRSTYQQARSLPVADHRLEAMCKGMWTRLSYMYQCRKLTTPS